MKEGQGKKQDRNLDGEGDESALKQLGFFTGFAKTMKITPNADLAQPAPNQGLAQNIVNYATDLA